MTELRRTTWRGTLRSRLTGVLVVGVLVGVIAVGALAQSAGKSALIGKLVELFTPSGPPLTAEEEKLQLLRRVQGNRWVAAKWLGLNRATVRKKLGVYNLTGAHRPPAGP